MVGLSHRVNGSDFSNLDVLPCPSKLQTRCGILGPCIFITYLCDGRYDCPDESDESVKRCGRDPCAGNIKCKNGACIPYSLCCNLRTDANCTHVHNCCPGHPLNIDFVPPKDPNAPLLLHNRGIGNRHDINGDGRSDTDTVIYVVTGAAMAFVFATLFFSIVASRYLLYRINRARLEINGRQGDTEANVEGDSQCRAQLLVYYNVNNGVQFCQPPPYSQIDGTSFMQRSCDLAPPAESSAAPPPYEETQSTTTTNAAQISTS